MDYKITLGIIAVIVSFVGYAPYLRDVFKGTTKPHAFSWAVWGILEITAFFAQLSKGGGAGAWVTGASGVIVLLIAAIAFKRNENEIKPLDWAAFSGGILGIILWLLTKDPVLAVILVTISDALGFVPTFRKSFYKPDEETLFEYGCAATKWILALFALQSLNLTTWLYPASLALTNGLFVVMSLIRRSYYKKIAQ